MTTVARFNEPDIGGPSHVIIDKSKHSLTLLRNGETPVVLRAQGAYAMKPGVFEVSRKEENPLWQAPPTYFLRRGLAVPPEGSSQRAMRGALGAQALFLTQEVAIHSGPLWNDDIGGIKLSNADMALLFKVVGVGTKVEVR
jgi:lipoprotein-anchoring transpeptidase ErfK/SrfK